MKEYDKIIELADSDQAKLSRDFKDLLHTHLVLGQTRHVCRWGTLSEGHDKITDAQRYYQAYREMYHIGNSVQDAKASAMEAQADLLDAEELPENTVSEKLRKESKILRSQTRIVSNLVTVEDKLRQLDEYNKVRLELAPAVEARYPEGIEQAERDNWIAVFNKRAIKAIMTGNMEGMENIPLSPEDKALQGSKWQRQDPSATLLAREEREFTKLSDMRQTVDNIARRLSNESKESAQKRLTEDKPASK